jgi:hypothetical protein
MTDWKRSFLDGAGVALLWVFALLIFLWIIEVARTRVL